MFEIGWTELMLIGIVALIVIGPKDLPEMFRTMGRFTTKMRSMARDFSKAMEQAAKETGVNDIAADLKAATSAKSMGLDAVKDAASRFEKWDPMKPVPKPTVATAGAAVVAEATPTVHGPSVTPLASAQAAKESVAIKASAKLRAAKAGQLAADTARKPRKVALVAASAKPAPKPRTPRNPAKDS